MRQPLTPHNLTLHNNGAFAHLFREAGRFGSIAMHGANTAIGLLRETLNPICTPLENAFKHRIRYVPYPFPVNSRLAGQ